MLSLVLGSGVLDVEIDFSRKLSRTLFIATELLIPGFLEYETINLQPSSII